MANITPTLPSFAFSYWRPWKEDSNIFDSYYNYVKDVSLAKYSADTIGTYVNQASQEQVQAINEVSQKIGQASKEQVNAIIDLEDKVDQGLYMLSEQIESGFKGLVIQLDETNQQLSFINQNLNLQVEQQIITNLLLEDLSKLLRVPDSEKKRQQHIELGLKFLANTKIDEDLFTDALEEFLAAEELMKQDYFVLHRIGMIYLFAPKHIAPQKALDYFKRAGKYASVESDPLAARLANILTTDQNVENVIITDVNALSLLAGKSFEKAAFAAYIVGDFFEAVNLGEKAKKHIPSAQNIFMIAKYQTRNGQVDDAIQNLNLAIDMMPELASACFSDIDLINELKILKLLEKKNDVVLNNINNLIDQLEKKEIYAHFSDNQRSNSISHLQKTLELKYSQKIATFDFIEKNGIWGWIVANNWNSEIYGSIPNVPF